MKFNVNSFEIVFVPGHCLRIVSKWSIEIEPTDRTCAVWRSTSQILEAGLKTI